MQIYLGGGLLLVEGRVVEYGGLAPFKLQIKYVDILPDDPTNTHEDHIHGECEIYINLTGDVSFMVENKIYPIKSGSVIITRPCEYHHCIYHSNESHEHLWILFESHGNESVLPLFFERPLGENNLIRLSEKQKLKVLEICKAIIHGEHSEKQRLADFMRILCILENADGSLDGPSDSVPEDISSAIEFIGENLGSVFTVADVAKYAHISVNTLERRFLEVLKTTPSGYIKSRRLARAAELLPSCKSVGEVCEECGFRDYSNFIAIFKKQFGVTPLKFKKTHEKRMSEYSEVAK